MPTTKRRPTWTQILNQQVEMARNTPFSWTEQNCCFWPAKVIEAMTGVDVAAGFRKNATSAVAVRRIVKRYGSVANIAAQVMPAHGFPAIPVTAAKRGNVVLRDTPHGYAGGVCLGAICAFPGSTGLYFSRLSECSHAFAT